MARKQVNTLSFETLEPKNLLTAITVGNATDLTNAPDTSSITALMANDGGDGISLREAIAAANNTDGEDAITFDGNIFTVGNTNLIRLTQGELLISDSLNIDGLSVGGVTITGDANGDDVTVDGTDITDVSASFGEFAGDADDLLDDNSRVINFSYEAGNLMLSGLTITGGQVSGDFVDGGGGILFDSNSNLTLYQADVNGNGTSGFRGKGGGVFTDSGNVFLNNSTVNANNTRGDRSGGGGIYNRLGVVSLNNSTVGGNSTSGERSFGGGIYTRSGDILLTGSAISANSAAGYNSLGGGIYAYDGRVSLTNNSTVSENISDGSGGGIITDSGGVLLNDSRVSGNITARGQGGGIRTDSGSVSLSNSALSGNSTMGSGGGISTFSGDVSLTNSTVSGNSASGDGSYGGGISTNFGNVLLTNSTLSGNSTSGNRSSSSNSGGGGIFTVSGFISLLNSTLSGNSTTGDSNYGGGIFAFSGSTILSVNSTITGNSTSGVGGGISLGSSIFTDDDRLTLHNSIVASNTDSGTAPDLTAVGDVDNDLIVENSLIGNTTGSGINNATGTGNILDQPALLGPLADNGGPTQTHALLPGSPAIDAGDNRLAVEIFGVPFATDQAGQTRFIDGNNDGEATVDLGAVEVQVVRTAGQHIFYNNSGFDVSSNSDAIATDKVALRNGETATFENYTSYVNGINGIAIDLFNPGTLIASDIGLRFGNSDDVATFSTLDASSTIVNLTTVAGVGVNGSDRVFIEFADGAITNGWLQVTVLANNNTGLTEDDVFYFGNAIGESGNDPTDAIVNISDVSGPRTNQTGFGITDVINVFDFNRDAVVNLADLAIARTNQSGFTPVRLITPTDSSGGPSGKLPPSATSTADASVALPVSVSTPEPTTSKVTTAELAAPNFSSFAVAANIQAATAEPNKSTEPKDFAKEVAKRNALSLVGANLDTPNTQQDILDQVFETTEQQNDLARNVSSTDIDSLFETNFSADF